MRKTKHVYQKKICPNSMQGRVQEIILEGYIHNKQIFWVRPPPLDLRLNPLTSMLSQNSRFAVNILS